MKKKIALVTALLMLVMLFAACGGSAGGSEAAASGLAADSSLAAPEDGAGGDKPFAGQELVYAGESGSTFTEFYKTLIPEFEEQTGATVTFFEVAHENTHERFLIEAMAGSGSIDVYQLDQPWVAEFAKMGFLKEITDDMVAEIDNFDFSESALGTMSFEDKLFGLPFQYHTPVLFYRTDLFEAAGLEGPPETWEEYREYALILNDPENGVYGTCLEGKAVGEPVTHFLDKMAQADAHYMDPSTGEVTFNSAETREALQFMYDIQHVDKTSPEGALGYENPDVYNLFLQGKVAMVSEWPYFYSGAQDPEQSVIAGKVGVAAQPAGKNKSSALWAFGYGISSASQKQDLAWEFCKWGTSPEVLAAFAIGTTTTVPRESANEIVYGSDEISDETKDVLRTITDASNDAVSYTTTPNFPAVQERLATTLSSVLSGLSTIDDEVAATQRDLESIIQE